MAAAAESRRIGVALLLVAGMLLFAQLAPAAACNYCPTPKPPPPPPPPAFEATARPAGVRGRAQRAGCTRVVGAKASDACCPLLSGVADLDAALCLCTTIKAKALSVSLVLPIAIEVLVNECGKHVPSSFQCP
ncbi:hypothetical protein GUJ93_ZPchr0458g22673 [Zizania palustris]|uniref:Bifunctional inhibitor/plant lipid transfer protein/seed storage helical domain-containing protein n=1 Tax=Zizania palustris TaxID=103762 RepID=A0A8J5RDM9_ZIZPA|nr:hypothetical protein GUJ93_ZPchr0458g22673 [Zizania palustris]